MARVMMLVGAEGAMLAETRVEGDGLEPDAMAQVQLRQEALISGFTDEEVAAAHFAFAGDPPNQP